MPIARVRRIEKKGIGSKPDSETVRDVLESARSKRESRPPKTRKYTSEEIRARESDPRYLEFVRKAIETAKIDRENREKEEQLRESLIASQSATSSAKAIAKTVKAGRTLDDDEVLVVVEILLKDKTPEHEDIGKFLENIVLLRGFSENYYKKIVEEELEGGPDADKVLSHDNIGKESFIKSSLAPEQKKKFVNRIYSEAQILKKYGEFKTFLDENLEQIYQKNVDEKKKAFVNEIKDLKKKNVTVTDLKEFIFKKTAQIKETLTKEFKTKFKTDTPIFMLHDRLSKIIKILTKLDIPNQEIKYYENGLIFEFTQETLNQLDEAAKKDKPSQILESISRIPIEFLKKLSGVTEEILLIKGELRSKLIELKETLSTKEKKKIKYEIINLNVDIDEAESNILESNNLKNYFLNSKSNTLDFVRDFKGSHLEKIIKFKGKHIDELTTGDVKSLTADDVNSAVDSISYEDFQIFNIDEVEGRKRRSKKNKKKKKGSRKPRGAQNGKKQSKRRRPAVQKKSRKKKN